MNIANIARPLAIVGALLTLLLSQGSMPNAAHAYEFYTGGACSKLKWDHDPWFRLSTISFTGDFSRDAVREPGNTVSYVGGQSLDFNWSTFNGNAAFRNGTNEVYAASLAQWDVEKFTGWARLLSNYATCKIIETDIIFDSADLWYRGVPSDYGFDYWDATYTLNINGQDRVSLRQTALHELLHAAGLRHEDNTWAIMNYGDRPWATHVEEGQMSPLPDDRRGLRVLYPSGFPENDVAVVNHYVKYDDLSSEGVPRQRRLCAAISGDGFESSAYSSLCATSPSFFVCPGDRIYTRFSIANYSTNPTTVDERLYFSSDTTLQTYLDTPSATVWQESLGAGRHHREAHSFVVPADLFANRAYNLIMHLDSDLGSEYEGNNWIPLRGQIITSGSCNPAFHHN